MKEKWSIIRKEKSELMRNNRNSSEMKEERR